MSSVALSYASVAAARLVSPTSSTFSSTPPNSSAVDATPVPTPLVPAAVVVASATSPTTPTAASETGAVNARRRISPSATFASILAKRSVPVSSSLSRSPKTIHTVLSLAGASPRAAPIVVEISDSEEDSEKSESDPRSPRTALHPGRKSQNGSKERLKPKPLQFSERAIRPVLTSTIFLEDEAGSTAGGANSSADESNTLFDDGDALSVSEGTAFSCCLSLLRLDADRLMFVILSGPTSTLSAATREENDEPMVLVTQRGFRESHLSISRAVSPAPLSASIPPPPPPFHGSVELPLITPMTARSFGPETAGNREGGAIVLTERDIEDGPEMFDEDEDKENQAPVSAEVQQQVLAFLDIEPVSGVFSTSDLVEEDETDAPSVKAKSKYQAQAGPAPKVSGSDKKEAKSKVSFNLRSTSPKRLKKSISSRPSKREGRNSPTINTTPLIDSRPAWIKAFFEIYPSLRNPSASARLPTPPHSPSMGKREPLAHIPSSPAPGSLAATCPTTSEGYHWPPTPRNAPPAKLWVSKAGFEDKPNRSLAGPLLIKAQREIKKERERAKAAGRSVEEKMLEPLPMPEGGWLGIELGAPAKPDGESEDTKVELQDVFLPALPPLPPLDPKPFWVPAVPLPTLPPPLQSLDVPLVAPEPQDEGDPAYTRMSRKARRKAQSAARRLAPVPPLPIVPPPPPAAYETFAPGAAPSAYGGYGWHPNSNPYAAPPPTSVPLPVPQNTAMPYAGGQDPSWPGASGPIPMPMGPLTHVNGHYVHSNVNQAEMLRAKLSRFYLRNAERRDENVGMLGPNPGEAYPPNMEGWYAPAPGLGNKNAFVPPPMPTVPQGQYGYTHPHLVSYPHTYAHALNPPHPQLQQYHQPAHPQPASQPFPPAASQPSSNVNHQPQIPPQNYNRKGGLSLNMIRNGMPGPPHLNAPNHIQGGAGLARKSAPAVAGRGQGLGGRVPMSVPLPTRGRRLSVAGVPRA